MTGSLFKAIDPRYIANIHGVTKSNLCSGNGTVRKTFGLISFDHHRVPNYDNHTLITSLNAQRKWNYFINDKLSWYYSRVLVSALMLQAFEKVEYLPSDTLNALLAWLPDGIHESEYRSLGGSVRVYTRNISKSVINDRTTIYLLNGQVITRKIYDAINPVFVKSLTRINDREKIAKFGYHKDVKEIVKVDLFEYDYIISNITGFGETTVRIIECPECNAYLVDGVQIDQNIYDALNRYYFKEVREIAEDDETFAPYHELFPKEQRFSKKLVIIISL
jgi:hypothetical protein